MCHVLQNSYSQGRTGVQVVLLLPMALPSLRAPTSIPKGAWNARGPPGRPVGVRVRSSLTHSHCVSIVLSQNCHQPIPLHVSTQCALGVFALGRKCLGWHGLFLAHRACDCRSLPLGSKSELEIKRQSQNDSRETPRRISHSLRRIMAGTKSSPVDVIHQRT